MSELILQLLSELEENVVFSSHDLVILDGKDEIVTSLLKYRPLLLIPFLVQLEPDVFFLLVVRLDGIVWPHHPLEVVFLFGIHICLLPLTRHVQQLEGILH